MCLVWPITTLMIFDIKGRKQYYQNLDSLGINYAGLLAKPSTVFEVNGVKYGFCSLRPNANTVSIHNLKGAARIIREFETALRHCDGIVSWRRRRD